MNNVADIRKNNKKEIYRLMLDGRRYTKSQVAMGTKLSVATCNTLLNDMKNQGIVTGEEKAFGEVGRSSILYRINEEHESYLAIYPAVKKGTYVVETMVFSPIGKILFNETKEYDIVDVLQLEKIVDRHREIFPSLKHIMIAMPGIVKENIVRYCDISTLNDVDVKADLEQKFGIETTIKNDLHFDALGYYKLENRKEEVITLAYFPSHILPGAATIHKGMIIQGESGFAGMMGFLPYGVSRQEQLAMLEPETCIPFIAMSVSVNIVLLNPGTIVLTGDLIDEKTLEAVKETCLKSIPEEYMPDFIIIDNFKKYLFEGMFQLALDMKKIM